MKAVKPRPNRRYPTMKRLTGPMSIMERMVRKFMGIVKEFEDKGSDSADEGENLPQKDLKTSGDVLEGTRRACFPENRDHLGIR